jgi:hypothetical protein
MACHAACSGIMPFSSGHWSSISLPLDPHRRYIHTMPATGQSGSVWLPLVPGVCVSRTPWRELRRWSLAVALFWGGTSGVLLPLEYFSIGWWAEAPPADLVLRTGVEGFVGGAMASWIFARARLRCDRPARRWAVTWCLVGPVACEAAVLTLVLGETIAPYYARSDPSLPARAADFAFALLGAAVVAGPPAVLTGLLVALLSLGPLLLFRRWLCRPTG